MSNPLSPEAVAWGVTYTPAVVAPGQRVWRCLSVEGPEEWGGRVSTFVEVLGMDGRRLVGVRVRWFWHDGEDYRATEPKPGDPFAVDFVMSASGNAYGLNVADGQPSDIVFGFGLPQFRPHHVFKVVYQLAVAAAIDPPPVVTPPVQPLTALQAIEQAERYLALAKGLL